jgi:hypothetical protein
VSVESCEVCGTTLRSDNRSGLCRRTPACRTERRRREAERAGTGLRCLCSCPRTDHKLGEGKEPCDPAVHPACGCTEFRLDARSRISSEDEDTGEAA